MSDNNHAQSINPQALLLTAVEAAAMFHKTVRTWRIWDSSGKIPSPIRIMRSTYWRQEELKEWVAAGCPDRESWDALKE
jgi:predicted DNA-binding transcriptional regulator AlpA